MNVKVAKADQLNVSDGTRFFLWSEKLNIKEFCCFMPVFNLTTDFKQAQILYNLINLIKLERKLAC